jgi:hypothetical protein
MHQAILVEYYVFYGICVGELCLAHEFESFELFLVLEELGLLD